MSGELRAVVFTWDGRLVGINSADAIRGAREIFISSEHVDWYEKNKDTINTALGYSPGRTAKILEALTTKEIDAGKDRKTHLQPVRNIEGRCNRCNAIMPKGRTSCTECV